MQVKKLYLLGLVTAALLIVFLLPYFKPFPNETGTAGGSHETLGDQPDLSLIDDKPLSTDQSAKEERAPDRISNDPGIAPSGSSPVIEERSAKLTPEIVDQQTRDLRMSDRVRNIIEEVQTRQLENQWEEALNEMNALYTEYESLNSFEQAVLLNFYTNTLLRLEMWQESVTAFSQMLLIDDLRPEINARALLALGQLHSRLGEDQAAVEYFENWLIFTTNMEGLEQQSQQVRQYLDSIASK